MSWLDQFFTEMGQAPIVVSPGPAPKISITPATNSAAGSMSAADKAKLDGIPGAPVASVSGTAPIVSSGGANPAISIVPATHSVPGSMSAADKTKLDGLDLLTPSAVFTVSFADWSGLGSAMSYDYVLPALPNRARLLAVVVENWVAFDDGAAATYVMALGWFPYADIVRGLTNIALGATGYPQTYIGSSPWDGTVGQVGFIGCYASGQQPMLRVISSAPLATATSGAMYVRLFYYYG